ncbi:C2 domain-containing protein [Aureococcus anophagefferens]|nr:C2 domain-containing protein [Aureococcus anophagefferens]
MVGSPSKSADAAPDTPRVGFALGRESSKESSLYERKPARHYPSRLLPVLKGTLLNRLEGASIGRVTCDVIEACRLPSRASLSNLCDAHASLKLRGWSPKGVPGGVLDVEIRDDVVGALGRCRLSLDDLACRGSIQRWWQLDVSDGLEAPSAAVHMRVTVAVSPALSAWSLIWSHRPLIDDSKFDVNVTYAAAMTLQDWADPLVDFQKRALDAVKWKHTPTTLDVDEISAAVTAFAASMNVKPPSADEVARAFAAVDDGDGILTLVEFQDFIFRFPDLAKALGVDAKRDDDLVVGEDGAESSDDDGDGASRQDTEVERVARTLAKWHPSLGALSTSHKKAIKAALPPAKSVRRSSLAPPRSMVPAPAPGPKKVFKGVAKKVINLAGRKAALAPYQHDLTSAVRDLDPLRELLAWDKPLVSGPFVAVNVLGAYAQLHLEPRTFFLMALALSFVYFTEWFKQLCLRLPDVGPRVFRAYAELRRRARARDESGDDEAGVRVARAPEPVSEHRPALKLDEYNSGEGHLGLGFHRRTLVKQYMVNDVFARIDLSEEIVSKHSNTRTLKSDLICSRIDRNTDHEISRDELVEYLRKAAPSPSTAACATSSPETTSTSCRRREPRRHGDGDVLTLAQFERVVFESDLTQTLLQTETLRHLLKEGLTCHKLGSNSWVEAAEARDGAPLEPRRRRAHLAPARPVAGPPPEGRRRRRAPDAEAARLHLLKLRKGDGPASMRTFSLDPKLRDALFHVLSGLVFPDRETPSTRHIIDDTLDEEVVLRKRPNATPRNFPGRVVPGEGSNIGLPATATQKGLFS